MTLCPSGKSWLWTSLGIAAGTLAAKYAGFPNNYYRENVPVQRFTKTLHYCQIGSGVTALCTLLLRLTRFSAVAQKNHLVSLAASIVGVLKFRYELYYYRADRKTFVWKTHCPWLMLCAVPSLFFSGFKKDVHLYALQYTVVISVAGTLVGAVLPASPSSTPTSASASGGEGRKSVANVAGASRKHVRCQDVGLSLSGIGAGSILVGVLPRLIQSQTILDSVILRPIADIGFVLLIFGFIVDDSNTIRSKSEAACRKQHFDSLTASLPLYFDTIVLFGCIAKLLDKYQQELHYVLESF